MAENADGVRPFPPPTIARWVRDEGVSTEMLVVELRYWADYMERLSEERRTHA